MGKLSTVLARNLAREREIVLSNNLKSEILRGEREEWGWLSRAILERESEENWFIYFFGGMIRFGYVNPGLLRGMLSGGFDLIGPFILNEYWA